MSKPGNIEPAPTFKARPLGSRILVEFPHPESVTEGGIIIPEMAKDPRRLRATVRGVGPGRLLDNGQRQEPEVRIGDTVLLKKHTGVGLRHERDLWQVCDQADVMAVLDK